MTRPVLAFAVATALAMTLAGCSSSSDDPAPVDNTPPTGGDGDPVVTPPTPSGPPATSGSGRPDGTTKAGTYVGSFGFGDNGVYVIDDDNDLAGLALLDDGSARSIFGNVGGGDSYTGTLRLQTHDPSAPPTAGVFGAGRSPIESTGEYTLSFTPGESIEGGNVASLTYAAAGQIPPATLASVAGSWRSENHFTDCGAATDGCKLIFDVTFNDTAVSGTTSVENAAGVRTRESTIAGVVSEYGDVLLLSFNWTDSGATYLYDGVVYFLPDGTERLVFLGETVDPASGNPTLGTLLTLTTP